MCANTRTAGPREQAILDALKDGPLWGAEIARRIGRRSADTRRALRSMAAKGWVRRHAMRSSAQLWILGTADGEGLQTRGGTDPTGPLSPAVCRVHGVTVRLRWVDGEPVQAPGKVWMADRTPCRSWPLDGGTLRQVGGAWMLHLASVETRDQEATHEPDAWAKRRAGAVLAGVEGLRYRSLQVVQGAEFAFRAEPLAWVDRSKGRGEIESKVPAVARLLARSEAVLESTEAHGVLMARVEQLEADRDAMLQVLENVVAALEHRQAPMGGSAFDERHG